MSPNIKTLNSTQWLRELEATLAKKKFRTALYTILNSPTVFGKLLNMNVLLNNKKLKHARWLYETYPYANRWLDYSAIDKLVKKYPKNHKYSELFLDKTIIDKWIDARLLSDAVPKAQAVIMAFAEEVIESIDFYDEESVQNINERVDLLQTHKWQIIANHKTNSDALVMQYCFMRMQQMWYLPPHYTLRFVRWIHMVSSPDVRAFSVWFNAIDILWPKDYKHIFRKLIAKQRSQDEEIKQLEDDYPTNYEDMYDWSEYIDALKIFETIDTIKLEEMVANIWKEINLFYPSAWRIPDAWLVNSNWLVAWVKPMLTLPQCVYLPVVFGWLTQFMKIWVPRLWQKIWLKKQWMYFKQWKIKMRVWKPFIWWSICAEEANQRLVDINFSLSNK